MDARSSRATPWQAGKLRMKELKAFLKERAGTWDEANAASPQPATAQPTAAAVTPPPAAGAAAGAAGTAEREAARAALEARIRLEVGKQWRLEFDAAQAGFGPTGAIWVMHHPSARVKKDTRGQIEQIGELVAGSLEGARRLKPTKEGASRGA